MELFYAYPENISDHSLILDSFEAKHLIKTLRKKAGDPIDVTDGAGNHYIGTIENIKPELTIKIVSKKKTEKEKTNISLGMAFIRPNRLEFVLEKGTELGVGAFHIFRSEHANYFSDNDKRFEKILRQAIKQSNRFWLPKLHLHKTFKNFIQDTKNIPVKIAAIAPNSPPIAFKPASSPYEETLLSIGPEGGFSESEMTILKEYGFSDVSLGKYRLRAETAALAGVARLIL